MAPVELLRRFAFHGIRISQLDRDVAYNGTTYPKGTWVIPMNQEFASLVQEVFEVQHYPEGADDNPYDAAGWTLPFQMGVNVDRGDDAALARSSARRSSPCRRARRSTGTRAPDAPLTMNATAAGIVPRAGGFTGTGDQVLLDPAQNNSFKLLARALAAGGTVSFRRGANGESRYVAVRRRAGQARRLGGGAVGHRRAHVRRDGRHGRPDHRRASDSATRAWTGPSGCSTPTT